MSATTEANLASLLATAAREHADRTALIAGDERITYAALDEWAAAFAQALHDGGVGPGDRVGILLPNVPGWVAAYYGIARLGAISVPLNVLLRDGEIEDRLADAGATALVAAPERGPGGLPRFDPDFVMSHHKVGPAPFAAVEADATAVLLYTSGTT
jgi:long-chain acyl-CoA synthetase